MGQSDPTTMRWENASGRWLPNAAGSDIAVVPVAIALMAGPGAISPVIVDAHLAPTEMTG